MVKLAIDPGHGMSNRSPHQYDPGAVGGGVAEADIALKWALTIAYILPLEFSIPVWLSRANEYDSAPLALRVQRGFEAGCTHWISLHCNSYFFAANGTETVCRVQDKRSYTWASIIQQKAVAFIGLRNRGVKDERESPEYPLAVMDFSQYGPTCLLEMGFVSNPYDRARLWAEPQARDRRIIFARSIGNLLKGGT